MGEAYNPEFWWIHSDAKEFWSGTRIAAFLPVRGDQEPLVVIMNETADRMGIRVWNHIVEREGWFKVKKIETPSAERVRWARNDAGRAGDGISGPTFQTFDRS